MRKLMYIYKDKINSCGSVLSIKELAKFLNRDINSVYRSIRILKKKKVEDLILKDSKGNKYLIITEDELDGRKWWNK